MRLDEDRPPPVEQRRHAMRQTIPFPRSRLPAVERRKLHTHMAMTDGVGAAAACIPRARLWIDAVADEGAGQFIAVRCARGRRGFGNCGPATAAGAGVSAIEAGRQQPPEPERRTLSGLHGAAGWLACSCWAAAASAAGSGTSGPGARLASARRAAHRRAGLAVDLQTTRIGGLTFTGPAGGSITGTLPGPPPEATK